MTQISSNNPPQQQQSQGGEVPNAQMVQAMGGLYPESRRVAEHQQQQDAETPRLRQEQEKAKRPTPKDVAAYFLPKSVSKAIEKEAQQEKVPHKAPPPMPQRKAPPCGPIRTYNLTGMQQAIARGMAVEQVTMAVAAGLPGGSGSAGSDGGNYPVPDIAPIPDYGGLQGSTVTISTEEYQRLRNGGNGPAPSCGAGAVFPPAPDLNGNRYYLIRDSAAGAGPCGGRAGKGCVAAGFQSMVRYATRHDAAGVSGYPDLESAISAYYREYPKRWLVSMFK